MRARILLVLFSAGLCLSQDVPASRPESLPATEFTLGNGLRVRLVSVDLGDEIDVILGIRGAGFLAEPQGIPRLASVARSAIVFSAPASTSESELIDRLLNPQSTDFDTDPEFGPDFMTFDIRPSLSDFDGALKVQARWMFGVRIGRHVLDGLKRYELVDLADLETKRTESADYLGEFAWSACVQAAFHGRLETKLREQIAAITPAAADAFHHRTFRPDRAMLTVAGKVDVSEARRKIQDLFGKAPRPAAGSDSRPALRPGAVQGTWDVVSNQFFMLWPSPPPSDPGHPALEIVSSMMWGRMNVIPEISKLTREKPQPTALSDADGFFVIQAPLRTKACGAALAREVSRLLETLAKDPLPSLKDRKEEIRGFAGIVSFDVAHPQKGLVACEELSRMKATLSWGESPESYAARVDKLTVDDIHAAIKTWLAPDKATIVTITGKE